MKPTRSLVVLWILFVAMTVLIRPARAEADYEFAKALLEREASGFQTTDLVERLAVRLLESAATQAEGKMVRIALLRRLAATAPAKSEQRVKFLDEANNLCKEIVAGPAAFRLYAVAEQETTPLTRELLQAKLDLAEKRPEESARLRKEAAALMEVEAKKHQAAAVAAFPEFKKWYDKYIEFVQRNPDRPIPREILDPLEKAFDVWILADKRYVNAATEQLECCNDADPARKPLADKLTKYCGDQADGEYLLYYPMVAKWYSFMQGRAYAIMQDHVHAKEAWNSVWSMDGDLNAEQRKQLFGMKKAILHELVRMKSKARNYDGVVELITDARHMIEFRDIWSEDLGKGLMIELAKAHILVRDAGAAEFETSLRSMQEMIDKEPHLAEHTHWTIEFSVTMAEIVRDAREKNVLVRPTAPQWYHAALGFLAKGQRQARQDGAAASADNRTGSQQQPEAARGTLQKAQLSEQACREYESAVDCYRRAITVARSEKTDLLTRLRVEPRAWSELAACYLLMRDYYEAIIACQALRGLLAPEAREVWLQAPLKTVPAREKAKVTEMLAEVEPLLTVADSRMALAFAENIRAHPDRPWDRSLPQREGAMKDPYARGQADLFSARALSRGARQDASGYEQAAAKYLSAAENFQKVEASSKDYETALFEVASALTSAQELWATGKLHGKNAADEAAQSRALAVRALEAFNKYDDATKAKPTVPEKERDQRAQLQGMILIAHTSLHAATREWEKVAQSADAYLAWEQSAAPQQSLAHQAWRAKFFALATQAAAVTAPACDALLHDATTALDATRKLQPQDQEGWLFMVETLSRRYTVAAAQARKARLTADVVSAYQGKVAELQSARLEALKGKATLADYASVLYLLDTAGKKREAADMAGRLLAKFDPQNQNARIPDDPKPWQDLLAKMTAQIKYADLTKWDRCKQDHRILVDYLYDTREGVALPENSAQRHEEDRLNQDLAKAARQLETIKRNYPDCQTLDPKLGQNGKALLAVVEDEVDFRQKIEATRRMLLDVALELAKRSQGDEARKYREIASKQIAALDDPSLRLKLAELYVLNEKYDEALKTLFEYQCSVDDQSEEYFVASRMVSEVYAKQGKWRDAAEYPQFIVATLGKDTPRVQKCWPEIETFLKDCYAHGVPQTKGK